MDLYAENILDHYRHPRHKEPVHDAAVTHREENLSCGDKLELFLKITDGKIKKVGWSGEGCAISQAAMSILAEELFDANANDAKSITTEHVYELLGVPVGPRRFKCALLCLHTLKNALNKHMGKEVQSWVDTVSLENE